MPETPEGPGSMPATIINQNCVMLQLERERDREIYRERERDGGEGKGMENNRWKNKYGK